jgi:hypothetical protein
VNFFTRKPRADVYFDDRLLSRTDAAAVVLRILIPLSLIAAAIAAGKGWIP